MSLASGPGQVITADGDTLAEPAPAAVLGPDATDTERIAHTEALLVDLVNELAGLRSFAEQLGGGGMIRMMMGGTRRG